MKNRSVFILGSVIATGLLLVLVGVFASPISAQSGTSDNNGTGNEQRPSFLYKIDNKYHKYENGVFTVRAGGGGSIAPTTQFFPKYAEIRVGETVEWISPTTVSEPHTVTFVNNNGLPADFAAPFVLTGTNSSLMSLDPDANAEPLTMPGPNGTTVVVAINSRSLNPIVMNASGNVTTLQPNGNYTIDGTEKYINSGWMWPKGQEPPGFPPINTFSVKFTKAGTYNYFCEVHPWMTGQVVVK